MNRQELRIELDDWFCGCGCPEEAAASLLRILRLHADGVRLHSELDKLIPDTGLQYLMLYTLDNRGYTEHGTSVTGSWLTDEGEAICNSLAEEEKDNFEALFNDHCIHGFDVDDKSHSCEVGG